MRPARTILIMQLSNSRGAGSHGCINLPTDQAALIYNTIDGGYPIIIY